MNLPILGIGGTLSGSAGIRNPYAMVQLIPGSTWTPNSLVRLNGTPATRSPSASKAGRIKQRHAGRSGAIAARRRRDSRSRDSDEQLRSGISASGRRRFQRHDESPGRIKIHGPRSTIL
jgi:hypothetical protein